MSSSSGPGPHPYSEVGLWHEKPEAWHHFAKGAKRRMVANSLTGTVTLFKMDPGNVGALHSHPHAQYGMCLEGSGTFTIGGKEFKVKKGDGWYIPPGIQHGLRVDSSQSATVIDFFTPHREDFSKEVLPSDQK